MANNPSNDLFQANEDVFVEALNTTKTNNVLLKDYFCRTRGPGTSCTFPRTVCLGLRGRRSGGTAGRTRGQGVQEEAAAQPKGRRAAEAKDGDEDLRQAGAVHLLPAADANVAGGVGGWKFEEAAGPTCGAVRNTTAAKKELENYKYTGFCKDHVQGEGLGSREHYERRGASP